MAGGGRRGNEAHPRTEEWTKLPILKCKIGGEKRPLFAMYVDQPGNILRELRSRVNMTGPGNGRCQKSSSSHLLDPLGTRLAL